MVAWVTRRRQYRQGGSFKFNKAERESYALVFGIRIISVVGTPFTNLKSAIPTSFYGRVTLMQRAWPQEVIDMDMASKRILYLINGEAGRKVDEDISSTNNRLGQSDLAELLEGIISVFREYPTPLPLPHKITEVKFKALPLSQFEFICHHLPFSEDGLFEPEFQDPPPNNGNDPYDEPAQNETSNPYADNDEPDEIPENADPRDFPPQDDPSDPNPPNEGTGNAFFTRRSNGFGPQDFSIPELGFPGRLVGDTRNEGNAVVFWEDQEGNRQALLEDTQFVEITNFEIRSGLGDVYTPSPDGLRFP